MSLSVGYRGRACFNGEIIHIPPRKRYLAHRVVIARSDMPKAENPTSTCTPWSLCNHGSNANWFSPITFSFMMRYNLVTWPIAQPCQIISELSDGGALKHQRARK
eukprot:scaffold40624_cov281-Isochrysis_galbana.AAC.2